MSDLTDYLETEIRDWMSQGTAFDSAPSTVYVHLHTSDPGESPDGSTEVSASDYSPQSVSAGSGWNTPTTDSFENANEINFGQATNDWGTISHVSLSTTSDFTGNVLASYALNSTVTINTNDTFKFNAGDLSFSLD
jgi:hypothetical protein